MDVYLSLNLSSNASPSSLYDAAVDVLRGRLVVITSKIWPFLRVPPEVRVSSAPYVSFKTSFYQTKGWTVVRLIDLNFLSDLLPVLYANADDELATHVEQLLSGYPSDGVLRGLVEALNDVEMNAAPGIGRTLFLFGRMLHEEFNGVEKVLR